MEERKTMKRKKQKTITRSQYADLKRRLPMGKMRAASNYAVKNAKPSSRAMVMSLLHRGGSERDDCRYNLKERAYMSVRSLAWCLKHRSGFS
ncbi:hypothetical protein D9C73_015048 [Collichthys lucidus]|uniref:Uncharacterized protein n=1 Tax=Collichthys lucidus TaxID=240159 RepID=A0A4U5UZU6_COLLU|nr:hypothetical protein D9C73_015048 [Collichthys lucidus]